ncbi:MAG: hypothetical protein IPL32_17810 [Chloracidobacterium sp.]|nr:hypothetical protein [Chloracidobacterium sp.]
MSTAGAILVGLSGLTGVSAGSHLLAITAGSGPGTPYPVLVSQFTVVVEEPTHTILQTKFKDAPEEVRPRNPIRRSVPATSVEFIATQEALLFVRLGSDELSIVEEQGEFVTITEVLQ